MNDCILHKERRRNICPPSNMPKFREIGWREWHSKGILQEHRNVKTMSWWVQDTQSGILGKGHLVLWFLLWSYSNFFHHTMNSWDRLYFILCQNHNSLLWLTQRQCSTICRIKINGRKRGGRKEEKGKRGGKKEEKGKSEEGERQFSLTEKVCVWTELPTHI